MDDQTSDNAGDLWRYDPLRREEPRHFGGKTKPARNLPAVWLDVGAFCTISRQRGLSARDFTFSARIPAGDATEILRQEGATVTFMLKGRPLVGRLEDISIYNDGATLQIEGECSIIPAATRRPAQKAGDSYDQIMLDGFRLGERIAIERFTRGELPRKPGCDKP